MSEDELNWIHEGFDFDFSSADSCGDNYGGYESDENEYESDEYESDDDESDDYESDDDESDDYESDDELSYFEFGFDEERYLFEYEPANHMQYYPGGRSPSYQIVFIKTEMLSKLLDAWQKRSKSNLQGDFSDAEYTDIDVNLYQLEEEDRDKLRFFSVRKFLEVMGGQEGVVKFREKIDQTLIFTKKVLTSILAKSLPMDLPYPALRNILSHLMRDEGLHMVGYMSSDDEVEKVGERLILSFLEDCIMFFYYSMKKVMFNSFSVNVSSHKIFMKEMMKRFEKHLTQLSVLAEELDTGEKVGLIVTSEECESEPV